MGKMHTSSLIRELRLDHNYTMQKVANILGVSKAAVSKWENGDDIATEHLYELAKLYNVSFTELYNGKLNDEKDSDYWRRNYDLSNFQLDDQINNKNVDNLKSLFDHCNMVKRRFFELLPKWAKNELPKDALNEFDFIKKYFKFDAEYYAYKKNISNQIVFVSKKEEKEFIKEIAYEIKDTDSNSYKWELSKLYDFSYDYKPDDICKSGNLKAIEYMVMSFNQVEKDSILYANLYVKRPNEAKSPLVGYLKIDRTEDEIENIPFFKIILKSGANALLKNKIASSILDEKAFNKIEGKKRLVDNSIYDKFSIFGFLTDEEVLNNWKIFTYNDYLGFIDKNETNHLRDVVNLKDAKPLKYYENLIARWDLNAK